MKIEKLIEKLSVRTEMYIGEIRLDLLKAYVDGYFDGLSESSSKDVTHSGIVVEQFQWWVEIRFGSKTTHGWDQIIRYHSYDDKEAVENFFQFFEEFLKVKVDEKATRMKVKERMVGFQQLVKS